MADGVTTPFLNPESISLYSGLYDVERCHAADMPEDNKPLHFLRIAGLS
jgi:hypothetical protein